MIALIWRGDVYIRKGTYYTVREELGVPDDEITPWAPYHGNIFWTENFNVKGLSDR
jgi:hypothetical protein